MKRSLIYSLGVALVVFVVYSCSKSTPSASNTTGTTGNTGATGSTGSTGTTTIPEPGFTGSTTPLSGTIAKTDTLKVVAYNVLNFGDGCQGTLSTLEGYMKTIVQYAQPDVFSCEKMNAFDPTQAAPYNLAAEINTNVLNALFPGKYNYCTPTNTAADSKMSVLFYNTQKLSFLSVFTLVANVSDFNLYKLYYKDPNLTITHDTTFLYVVVNHTQSGGNPTAVRDAQETAEMVALRKRFAYLPNLINMGDFNQHASTEAGYQAIISAADTTTKMSDPPFYPDNQFQYPANWDVSPVPYSTCLTTSTRQLATVPNSCGTNGGASSWYDHIFISPWLVSGSNYISYVPHSYQTIGNDGQRAGVDINSATPVVNISAPTAVINALFQFSNKYPVSIKLVVRANRSGGSIPDPVEKN